MIDEIAPSIGEEVDEEPKYSWSFDADVLAAEKNGFEIIRSSDTTLLLDLDDGLSLDRYRRILPRLANLFGLKEERRWTSKSGIGLHVIVRCNCMGFTERIALQACLGSDPMRESLALAMKASGIENPSVLFKPPQEKTK